MTRLGLDLSVVGHALDSITLDSGVVLRCDPENEYEFRIEQPIRLRSQAGEFEVRYDPYAHRPSEFITELTVIINTVVERAHVHPDGKLELIFNYESGVSLEVEPHPKFEAWTYVHGNFILACPPGGQFGPGFFEDPRTENERFKGKPVEGS